MYGLVYKFLNYFKYVKLDFIWCNCSIIAYFMIFYYSYTSCFNFIQLGVWDQEKAKMIVSFELFFFSYFYVIAP